MLRYDGVDIAGIAPHRLIDLGIWYIPQESSLFPFLSLQDNLLVDHKVRRAVKLGRGWA